MHCKSNANPIQIFYKSNVITTEPIANLMQIHCNCKPIENQIEMPYNPNANVMRLQCNTVKEKVLIMLND